MNTNKLIVPAICATTDANHLTFRLFNLGILKFSTVQNCPNIDIVDAGHGHQQ